MLKIIGKGAVAVAVDLIPAGESVKKIIQNVAANGNTTKESTGNSPEVYKIIRAIIVAGLIYALLTGKIDLQTLNNTLDGLAG